MNTNWFRDPASLDTLSLAGNQIEVVDATALHGLTNLKQLRLNNNRIRTIHPDSFTSLVSLTELDLSDNRLTRLSPRLLGSLRSVRSIRLHGNRWSCWCDAEDFVASLKGTVISSLVHSKPAFTPFTVLKASRATDSASSSSPLVPDIQIFVTLVSIIVLLSLLLGGMCLLLVMHRQKRNNFEDKRQEREMQQQMESLDVETLELKETYSSLQQEVDCKTKKLTKLFSKLQVVKDGIDKIKEERQEFEQVQKKLTRDLKLKKLIIENFIPPEEKFISTMVFDEEE